MSKPFTAATTTACTGPRLRSEFDRRHLPIAALRQNPAPALKAVSEGRSLVVTSHNRPVADLVPHVERRGVSPADFTEALVRTRVDSAWAAEIEAGRSEETDDPWNV